MKYIVASSSGNVICPNRNVAMEMADKKIRAGCPTVYVGPLEITLALEVKISPEPKEKKR